METPEHNHQATEYELNSIEDDQGLKNIAFVLHGNSSIQDSDQILHEGMRMQEGRATISTDLAHAVSWATTTEKRDFSQSPTARAEDEVGRVFVLSIPEGQHLGYGIFTSMKVSESAKEVKGAPIKYASGRKQLALYETGDTESMRRQIETGHVLGQEPKALSVPPDNIIASLYPSDELKTLVDNLQSTVRRFEKPDIESTTGELTRIIATDNRNVVAPNAPIDQIAQQLVTSTIESAAISRARNLDLDVKRALGYKILTENGQPDTKTVHPQSVRRRIQDFYAKTHAEDFQMGSPWLTHQLIAQSEKMMEALGSS